MKRGINLGVVLLGVCFIGLLFVGFLVNPPKEGNDVTGNTPIMISTENAIMVPGMTADLESKEEGTIMWWTKPEMKVFADFADRKEYLIMFSSKNLPGLMIAYGYAESNLVGGTPMMQTSTVDFLNNKSHQIAYTFKKGGEQVIYFDAQMMVRGEYRESEVNILTGNAVAGELSVADESIVDRVETVDRALTQEELEATLQDNTR